MLPQPSAPQLVVRALIGGPVVPLLAVVLDADLESRVGEVETERGYAVDLDPELGVGRRERGVVDLEEYPRLTDRLDTRLDDQHERP